MFGCDSDSSIVFGSWSVGRLQARQKGQLPAIMSVELCAIVICYLGADGAPANQAYRVLSLVSYYSHKAHRTSKWTTCAGSTHRPRDPVGF